MNQSLETIRIGFLPLLDAALIIVAANKKFAQDEGLDLQLHKETSWANIRDRLATGHFEMAHMLAPMPVAASLGLTPMKMDIIVPMALGLGGNAVTVSRHLYEQLEFQSGKPTLKAQEAGSALSDLIAKRKEARKRKLVFAVVHPYSAHNYDLRYWLNASGINPDEDVEIIVIPPGLMPDALASEKVDGFCVGAPWNSVAVDSGAGAVLTTKSEIWRSSPEKVLGVSADWAESHPEQLKAILRALVRAAKWCEEPGNHEEMAFILSKPAFLDVDAPLIEKSIKGVFPVIFKNVPSLLEAEDYFIPYRRAATFPWQSHALWFYTQMVRWGHAKWEEHQVELVKQTYRPDIYRSALASTEFPLPGASSKVEGALRFEVPVGANKGEIVLGPDGFFDGKLFDPDKIASYVETQLIFLRNSTEISMK